MKNIINYLLAHCAIAILFFVNVATAQTPNSFRYQAVVRNASGLTLQTQNVNLRITLLQGTTTGTSVYSEEHTVTTNEFGMVNIEIGSGSTQIGTIAGIDWANGPYFIKIELDATGGNSFVEMGTTQLLSVPYALYAASGTEGPQGIQGVQGPAGQDGQQGVQGEQGVAGQNGISILWLGTFAASPANPVLNNAYYNSTDKKSYVFDGSTWQILAQDGATGAQGIQGTQGLPGTNATIHSGTGISISNDTIYNTNLGSAINLTGSGATSVSGTYPNITISSTDNNTLYSAGNGLSLSGTTFNSAWSNNVNNIYNNNGGNVGIGTSTPLSSLHIQGSLRLNDDTEGLGKVLTSDAFGNGTWQNFIVPSFSGTVNFLPKFTGLTSIGNSIVFESNNKIGVGTTTPSGKLEIQADAAANPADILFQVKDKFGNPVVQIYQDSIHFWVDDDPSKAENRGAFAVSGKNSTKSTTSNYFHLNTDNLFSGKDAGKKLSGTINYTGYSNNFLGYEAGYNDTSGYKNIFLGYRAGYSNTSGYSNIFIGDSAGYTNTTGIKNVFIGNQSGLGNTSGSYNVANGFQALYSNTWGTSNVAIGNQTLHSNTTGSDNTALGYQALYENISGTRNVASGHKALYKNTGGGNVANGYMALYSNTSGNNNVGIGYGVLFANTTGTNNTALGNNSFTSGSAYSNSTTVGANASMTASNKIRFGNSTVTVIEGQVAYTFPSDGRFKNNVTEEVKGLDFITRLRPVVYNFDTRKFDAFQMIDLPDSLIKERMKKIDYNESSSIRQSGFIAQEVIEAAKEAGYDFNGVHTPISDKDNYSVAYSLFTIPLVKAVQELNNKNISLENTFSELQKIIVNLQSKNNRLQEDNSTFKINNEKLKSDIEQIKAFLKINKN